MFIKQRYSSAEATPESRSEAKATQLINTCACCYLASIRSWVCSSYEHTHPQMRCAQHPRMTWMHTATCCLLKHSESASKARTCGHILVAFWLRRLPCTHGRSIVDNTMYVRSELLREHRLISKD